MGYSLKDGKIFIGLARKSIEYYFHTNNFYNVGPNEDKYLEKRGVFVTIHSFPEKELRGCIGFPYPVKELWYAIIEAAVMASFNDYRFKSLMFSELNRIIIELSILTKPTIVKNENISNEIVIGKHGLIVKKGNNSGLLLPQVATEHNLTVDDFLEQCCIKAGIIPNAWKLKETSIYKFQAQIFSEKEPNGDIIELT